MRRRKSSQPLEWIQLCIFEKLYFMENIKVLYKTNTQNQKCCRIKCLLYSPPGYYPKNPSGISPLTWIFFPSLHKYAAFWYSAGCSLGTFDIGIFPPHLKALPHAYITSAAFSPRPFALAGQKTKCGGGLRSLRALQKKSFSLIMIMLLLAHGFLSKKVKNELIIDTHGLYRLLEWF